MMNSVNAHLNPNPNNIAVGKIFIIVLLKDFHLILQSFFTSSTFPIYIPIPQL